MKKLFSVILTVCLVLCMPGCSKAASSSLQEGTVSYLYEYEGMMGPETARFDFAADGSCTFSLPGNKVITDVYTGTYTRQENEITVEGLANVDANAQHPTPGLWSWIVDGGAVITVDDAAKTFAPSEAAPTAPQQGGAPTVAYAQNSPAQTCDIYQPQGKENAPVIVLVHGGGFAFGDAKMPLLQPVIDAALARGYAVVSVDYRKSGEAVFPAALADVKAAVRFVRENAEEYGFDPSRVALWGESAGAYLSLMTALTPEVEELNGDVADCAGQPSDVRALVSFYAPVEFYTLYEEAGTPEAAADSFESKFLGADITADKEFTYTTYWETYADQLPQDLQVWIQAGDADSKVPCTQSQNLAQRLAGYIGEEKVQFDLLAGADHEDEQFYSPDNLSAVLDWLDVCMKG